MVLFNAWIIARNARRGEPMPCLAMNMGESEFYLLKVDSLQTSSVVSFTSDQYGRMDKVICRGRLALKKSCQSQPVSPVFRI